MAARKRYLRLLLPLLLLAVSTACGQSVLTWSGTGGPCGFPAIRLIPLQNGLLATSGRTIHRSSDGGRSWNPWSTVGVPGFVVHAHAVAPSGDIIVGGHGNPTGAVLFRSSDEGRTWNDLFLPGRSGAIVAVTAEGTILAGGAVGPIQRSTDNGITWNATAISGVLASSISALPDGTVLAGGIVGSEKGIYRSTDDGISWIQTFPISPAIAVASIAATGQSAATAATSSNGVILMLHTSNSGEEWNVGGVSTNMQQVGMMLAVPSEGTLYAATKLGQVFRQNAANGEWTRVGNGLPQSEIYSIAFDPNGEAGHRLFAATDHGPFRLDSRPEGEIWVPGCGKMLGNESTNIAITPTGNLLVATRLTATIGLSRSMAVYRSTNGGAEWLLAVRDRFLINAVAEAGDGAIIFGTVRGGLRRFGREDDSARRIDRGFSSDTITAVAAVDGNEIIAGTPQGSLYTSKDNGVTWDSILPSPAMEMGAIMAIVPRGDDLYIAATNGLFHRRAGASTLDAVAAGSGPQSFTTLSIAPGGYMAVAGDEWAWHSSNNGESWKKLPHLASGRAFTSIVVDGEGKVYAVSKDQGWSTSGWVYFVSATEARWRDADRPTDSLGAYAIALHPNGTLYASSPTEVFRAVVPSTVPFESAPVAERIKIGIAPTPATSSATIRFTLGTMGEATLTLSDAGGREVMRKDLGVRTAGEHIAEIDLSQLSPGVYPCEIRSGEDRATSTVHVVR